MPALCPTCGSPFLGAAAGRAGSQLPQAMHTSADPRGKQSILHNNPYNSTRQSWQPPQGTVTADTYGAPFSSRQQQTSRPMYDNGIMATASSTGPSRRQNRMDNLKNIWSSSGKK
jgi:hypothetical protein